MATKQAEYKEDLLDRMERETQERYACSIDELGYLYDLVLQELGTN